MAILGTKRFWLVLTAMVALWAVAAVALLALAPSRRFEPQITLTVHGYALTNQTHELNSANEFPGEPPEPPPAGFGTELPNPVGRDVTNSITLIARVTLCNTGRQPIGFESQSKVPEFRLEFRLGYSLLKPLFYPRPVSPQVLKPGERVDFLVWLPPETSEWGLRFYGYLPSVRLGVARRVLNSPYASHLPTFLICAFLRQEAPHTEIWSGECTVPPTLSAAGKLSDPPKTTVGP